MSSYYDNEVLALFFYWIGWSWGWAIKIIRDSNMETKIRLTKCKKENEFPETKMYEWEEIDPDEINNLKEAGGHVNFKKKWELEECFSKLEELFDEEL